MRSPVDSSRDAAVASADTAAVARGGLANLAGSVVSAAANFAIVVIATRYLSHSAAGAFFGITSLFVIVESVGRLGGDVGAVYFIARWRAQGLAARIRTGLRVALVPVLVVGVVAGVVMYLLAPQLSDLVGDGSAVVADQLRVLAVLLPIAVGYEVLLGATRGLARMRATVLLEKIVRPLLQVALLVLALAVGASRWVGAAWGVPYAVVAIFAVLAVRTAFGGLSRHPGTYRQKRDPVGVAREFWTFALPRALASVAQIALQRLDIVLVAALRGPAEAAVYTAASRFLVVGQFVTQSLAAPVQPRLSAALATDADGRGTARAAALFRLSTAWSVLASWPLFLLAAVFAPVYLAVFGRGYTAHHATAVVVLLALSMLVASATGLVDSVVLMAGRTSWNLATTLLALAVNVVLDLVLIPPYGLIGAAVGWCAAIVAANLAPLLLAWRGLHLHPFDRRVGTACAAAALAFAAVPLLGYAAAGVAGAIVGTAVGSVAYVVFVARRRAWFELDAVLGRSRSTA